jgi:hypothetical protein
MAWTYAQSREAEIIAGELLQVDAHARSADNLQVQMHLHTCEVQV